MQTFFFDMKDGVPMRDRVGIDFKNDLEASTVKSLHSTSAMAACGMIRTSKYRSLTAAGERSIASSIIAIEGRSVGVGLGLHRRFECIKMENK
jgi:hypothetical protein